MAYRASGDRNQTCYCCCPCLLCVFFAAFISYANLVNNNQRVLAWPTSPIHERSGAVCTRAEESKTSCNELVRVHFSDEQQPRPGKSKLIVGAARCYARACRDIIGKSFELSFVCAAADDDGMIARARRGSAATAGGEKSFELKVQINYTSHDTVGGDRVTCEKGLKFFLRLMYFSNQSLQNLKRERWRARRRKEAEKKLKLNA